MDDCNGRAQEDGMWRWDGDWEVDTSADTDQDGWQYGFSWATTMGPDCTATSFVRRRRWVRVRRKIEEPATEGDTERDTERGGGDAVAD